LLIFMLQPLLDYPCVVCFQAPVKALVAAKCCQSLTASTKQQEGRLLLLPVLLLLLVCGMAVRIVGAWQLWWMLRRRHT
jgi:hypothetical protein